MGQSTATPEEAWGDLSYTNTETGEKIVLGRMGPASVSESDYYAGFSINGVSQGTGVYAPGQSNFRTGFGNGVNNFTANYLNQIPDADVTGQFYPVPTQFSFGINPLNSGITTGSLFGLPRVAEKNSANFTQWATSGVTQGGLMAAALLASRGRGGPKPFSLAARIGG